MKKLKNKIFLITLITMQSFFVQSKIIIWDIGGVLLDLNKWQYAKEIGIWNLATYIVSEWESPNLKSILFDILRKLESEEEKLCFRAPLEDGSLMPLILSQLLKKASLKQQ